MVMLSFFNAISFDEIFKATMVLFAVIDIIGSIPIIIKYKETAGKIDVMRITLISLALMVSFLVMGESILSIFGVDIESFAVAGALILYALAIEMVMGITLFKDSPSDQGKGAGIVPLAFPIIAGAGSMTTLVAIRAEYEMINILIAILINIVFVYIVMKSTRRIEKMIGHGGIAILQKVFGIILLAIATKLFVSNIANLLS